MKIETAGESEVVGCTVCWWIVDSHGDGLVVVMGRLRRRQYQSEERPKPNPRPHLLSDVEPQKWALGFWVQLVWWKVFLDEIEIFFIMAVLHSCGVYIFYSYMWEPMPLMKFEVLRPEPGYCWITGNYWSKHSYICILYNICINKIFINIFRKQPCQYWYRYFQELPYQYQYFSKVSIYRWLSFCVFCVLVALLTENYGENFWILTLFSRRF